MATRKSANEVAQIKVSAEASRKKPRKPILFGQKIDDLKKGEGLLITSEEWKGTKLKTPLPSYYYSKYNKDDKKTISITKTDEGYLVVKLK
jgi:hypothetical protein